MKQSNRNQAGTVRRKRKAGLGKEQGRERVKNGEFLRKIERLSR
jgi:hypothetical protein